MLLELGNADPILPDGDDPRQGWCTTYVEIPDDPENFGEDHHAYQQVIDPAFDGETLRRHLSEQLLEGDGRVTHLPGHESVIAVASPFGIWNAHAKRGTKPKWINLVSGDDKARETVRILADYYGCSIGRPVGYEDTHWTVAGPPGAHPDPASDVTMNITQNGRDIQARVAFGGAVGLVGTATATGTTSLTESGATWTSNQFQGFRVVALATGVWANIISNTSTVLTLDRWYTPATPGGSAGATPSGTTGFVIMDGGAPSWFMGLSTSTTGVGTPSTNTTLPSEITTSGGGLVRQICPWAHTASAATTTLTPVYTANGSDSLPVIVGSIGTANSMVPTSTPNLFFNTVFSSTATLSSIGDQLTVTQTITGT